MRRTVEEINHDINVLMHERNRANAVTADGVPIEVGMTLYTWDGFGLDKVVVPKNVEFRETAIHCFDPYTDELYNDLYTDPTLAVEEVIRRAERDVTNAKARLKGAEEQLERYKTNLKAELEQFKKPLDNNVQ